MSATEIPEATRTEIEAAAFRRLVEHFRERTDVQNLDVMNLAGFCRNCLSKWYRAAAAERGVEICRSRGARGDQQYAEARRGSTAFDVLLVAATSADCILRAESWRDNFESGAHVIVEAANQSPISFVGDAAHGELLFHFGEMISAGVAEMIGNSRKIFDDGLLFRNFGIQHAQRICFDAALAIGAQFVANFV